MTELTVTVIGTGTIVRVIVESLLVFKDGDKKLPPEGKNVDKVVGADFSEMPKRF